MTASFKYIIIFCPAILAGFLVFAQDKPQNNISKKQISARISPIKLDSFLIVPGSLQILGVNPQAYEIDHQTSTLIWKRNIDSDSVWVSYRTFKFPALYEKRKRNYEDVRYNFLDIRPISLSLTKNQHRDPFSDFNSIESEGSLGRVLSFGNNQDAIFNSNLNLQLHGYIGDSLELTAMISDNNIPIQPDGNTKDLRDFDRILMQIGKKNWKLSLGDIELKQTKDPFLQFSKRIQGISFVGQTVNAKRDTQSFMISGAVGKGKYNRNVIQPIEGNQGPYRLKGANNEIYFVVLAGTEKVFMDGQLLQRGEDQDYVINYNTAELIFTPRNMITKDKRIQVEFEYAERNYLNTQIWLNETYKSHKDITISLSAFLNTDAKNTSIDQLLTPQQKQRIYQAGDSLQLAVDETAFVDSIGDGKILYKRIDTLYNGLVYDSIFVYSNSPTDTLYNVSFSFVGAGKGRYVQSLNGSNGKVYQWSPPLINGQRTGDYEPVRQLVTPKSRQIYTLSVQMPIGNKWSSDAEIAMSHTDMNLLSNLDTQNKTGWAAKWGLRSNQKKVNIYGKPHILNAMAGFEYVQKRFNPAERIRSIEFLRDWSLPTEFSTANEQITHLNFDLTGSQNNQLSFSFTHYVRDVFFKGWKQQIGYRYKHGGFSSSLHLNWLQFSDSIRSGFFFRPTYSSQLTLSKKLFTGWSFMGEFNPVKNSTMDTLLKTAFSFFQYEAFLKSDSTELNKWSLKYFSRTDYLPMQKSMSRVDRSDNLTINTEFLSNANRQLKFNTTLRNLQVFNGQATGLQDDRSLLGRIDYHFNESKGLISGNCFYELGGGQEQRREFSFVAVPAGQGTHTWMDYNNNGIEELNEFELAVFADQRKYVKIFTPTNQYVKATSIQFNLNLEISPSKYFKNPTRKLKKILSKLNLNTSLQQSRKYLYEGIVKANPFATPEVDSVLLSSSQLLTNLFQINKGDLRWNLDLIQQHGVQKNLLLYGFESLVNTTNALKLRIRLNKKWQLNCALQQKINQLQTQSIAFNNRNYDVEILQIDPSLTYQFQSRWRLQSKLGLTKKRNRMDGGEKLNSVDLTLDMKYNTMKDASVSAKFIYQYIRFEAGSGSAQTPVGYLMLEALLPGKNLLWNIDFTKRIGKNLEAGFQYEGRQNSINRIIHIGRASVRALF